MMAKKTGRSIPYEKEEKYLFGLLYVVFNIEAYKPT